MQGQLHHNRLKLFHTLLQRLRRLQSREVLLRDVWGDNFVEEETRTVDTHITRLRTKMGAAGDMIKTVRGFGGAHPPPQELIYNGMFRNL